MLQKAWILIAVSWLLLMPVVFASDLKSLCKRGYGVITETTVSEDFEGCEYGKIIPFDNGLGLKCTAYKYHYAYRPQGF